ncbi:MAG: GDP-mannose 4,6-dehydratase [Omnitrophica bacterium]|nr:GDP-mannose 4,6-dehydratase [Candidatus Omnitrophota bacterium]
MVKKSSATYLITGVSGFVGGHYLEYLLAKYQNVKIFGLDTRRPKFAFLKNAQKNKFAFYQGSLLNKKWLAHLIKKAGLDYIVNLASYSSVAYSWKHPVECAINNTDIFLNIAEAARKSKVKPKILSVGSSEEYGITRNGTSPVTEDTQLSPANPYAVARVAQECYSNVYAGSYRMPLILTRSFNHIGPRQKDIFAVSALAKQVIEVKKGKRDKVVHGDLNIIRDFTDVRDIVRAYDLLLRKGKIGNVYNVCSGEGHRLKDVLNMLAKEAGIKNLRTKQDPNLTRPIDNKAIIGSCAKLKQHTGFKTQYPLSQSLKDILNYWERRL